MTGAATTTNGGADAEKGGGLSAKQLRARSRLEKLVRGLPIPENFWARDEDLETIGPRSLISVALAALHALTLLAFVGAMIFYSSDAQRRQKIIISNEIAIDGYECVPLSPDPFYGLNYTYEECLTKIRPLTEANIDFSGAELASGASQTCSALSGSGTVPCNCTGTKNIIFDPFGDDQRNRGIWPKLPEARSPQLFEYVNQVANPTSCVSEYQRCEMMTRRGDTDTSGVVGDCSGFNISRPLFVSLFEKTVEHLGGDLCDFTKHNLPYKCVKMEKIPFLERSATAYNNAELIFVAALSVFCLVLKRRRNSAEGSPAPATKSKHWVTKLPLPPAFYDEERQLELISNHAVIAVVTVIVGSATTIVFFIVMFVLMSSNETDIVITGEWQKAGYDCVPLSDDNVGFGVNYTYAQCLEKIRLPVTEDALEFKTMSISSSTTIYMAKFVPFEESDEGLSASLWKDFDRPSSTFTTYGTSSYMMEFWDAPPSGTWWNGSPSARVRSSSAWDETTKANAVATWQVMMDMLGDSACDFTKDNPPYQCTKSEPPGALSRLSFAYGNAKTIFVILWFGAVLLVKRRDEMLDPAQSRIIKTRSPMRVWSSRLPLPEKFYVQGDLDLISYPKPTLYAFLAVVMAALAALAALVPYYAAQTVKEIAIEAVAEKDGFTCAPLNNDAWYGKNWSYEECLTKLVHPSTLDQFADFDMNAGGSPFTAYDYDEYKSFHVIRFRPFGNDVQGYKYFEGVTPANATFDAFFTSAKSTFDAIDAQISIESTDINDVGIFIKHDSASSTGATAIVNVFTSIYEELGADAMCAWTKTNFPYQCVRETKLPPAQVAGLAFGNVSLFATGFVVLVTQILKKFYPAPVMSS